MITRPTTNEKLRSNEDATFSCVGSGHAAKMLRHFGIEWSMSLVLRQDKKWDVIMGKPRASVGVVGHYVNDTEHVVASYSQTRGALIIYGRPAKISKIYLHDYNIRRRNDSE